MNLNAYSPQIILGACIVVFIVMLLIAWGIKLQHDRRRTAALRARFGPEYDAALAHYGSRRKVEAALEGRLRRAETYHVRSLTANERARFLAEWDSIQARFIEFPRGAVIQADELIGSVLQLRGYPRGTIEQRCSDLSVHNPRIVDQCRRANAITVRAGRNEASTEDLRTAMILYRSLLDDILETKTITMPRTEAA